MAITFTSNLDLKNNRITNLGAPAVSTDGATKQYVDNIATGLIWKDAVRVAADTNVSVSSPGTTIDGVTLAANDRVLLMGQTAASENGLYVYTGTALVRSGDADTASEMRPGTAVTVSEGTTNGNHTYVLITDGPVTLGTTALSWSLLNAGTSPVYTAGNGIDVTNHQISAVPAPNAGLSVGAAGIGAVADPAGGVQIGTNGIAAKLVPNTALTVDTNGIRFVPRPNYGLNVDSAGAGVVIKANSGLAVDATGVQTVIAPNKGLTVDATGLQAVSGNGVTTDATGIKAVADPAGGLQVTAPGIGAKLDTPSALKADTNGLAVVADPAGGLSVTATGIKAVPKPNSGVAVDATGLSVVLRPNDGLDVDATGVGITTDPAGSLATSATGLAVVPEPNKGLATSSSGLATVLDAAGGLRVDNLGLKLLADPTVRNDPAKPSLIVSSTGVAVNTAVFPQKFAASVGDNTATTFTLTHNLNTLDVQVTVYEVSSGQTVYADSTRTGVNTVSLDFGSVAPTSGQYRVVVVG